MKYVLIAGALVGLGGVAELFGSEIAGIGVAIHLVDEQVVVQRVLPDSPAAVNKTIGVGDRIVSIGNGNEPAVALKGLKLAEVVRLIRGEKGTTVRLTIVPSGQGDSLARAISLVRGELKAFLYGDGELLPAGTKAPNFEMTRLSDKTREQLADHTGRILILEFWATWCGPCQAKMAELQTYAANYPNWKNKVLIIAIDVDDDMDAAAAHVKANGWDKSHNVWSGSETLIAYHVDGLPTAYVIDSKGIVIGGDVDIVETVDELLRQDR